MCGPFEAEHWSAMQTELTTLHSDLQAWEYVRRTPSMRVLPSTWDFKCKRRPDGEASKLEARFVVRGDQQVEGIDYFKPGLPFVTGQPFAP